MIRLSFMLGLGILGLGLMLILGPRGRAEPPSQNGGARESPSQQEGVEFLARGPIHEAFAQPTIRAPRSSAIISKQPPKPVEELPPDQKPEGDHVQWIPGYWAWDDDASNFLWVSGTYRAVPPGRHWVPGHWNHADDGWQWIAGLWADQEKNELEFLPAPPDPIEEAVAPAPADAGIFQPGCWVHRDGRYLWRRGFWAPFRAGWIWTPAAYVWTPGGNIFNEGFWDYAFRDRGLLFAPANIDRRYWGRPGWLYQPSYVVRDDFLLTALFVRPNYCHYYFGDYFDLGYNGLGFVPWTDYRYGRNIDPLFIYYQRQFRDNPRWSRDLQGLYAVRRQNPAARPPRTLVQQNTVINNITNKAVTTNNVTNIKNVTALTALTKVDNTFVKLQPVTRAQRGQAQKAVSQFRGFSTQRETLEAQARKRIHASTQAGELPKAIKVELPKTRWVTVNTPHGAKATAPPAHPVMPELDPKVQPGPKPHHPPPKKAKA